MKKVSLTLVVLLLCVAALSGCGKTEMTKEEFDLYKGDELVKELEFGDDIAIEEGSEYEDCNTKRGIGLGSTLEEVYQAYKDMDITGIYRLDDVNDERFLDSTLQEFYDQREEHGEGTYELAFNYYEQDGKWVKAQFGTDNRYLEEEFDLKKEVNSYLLSIHMKEGEVIMILLSVSNMISE